MLTIVLQLVSYLIAFSIPYFMLTGKAASHFYFPLYAVPILLLSYFSGPMAALGMVMLSVAVGTGGVIFTVGDWKNGTPFLYLIQIGWFWLLFWMAGRTIEKKDLEVHRMDEKIEKLEILSTEISTRKKELVLSCEGLKERMFRYSQLSSFTDELTASLILSEIQKKTEETLHKFFWGMGQIKVQLRIFPQPEITPEVEGLDRWVSEHRIPLLIEDCSNDPRCSQKNEERKGSLVVTPLEKGVEIIGVLEVSSPQFGCWKEEDLRFFSNISNIISLAVTNALLYEKVESLAIKDSLTGLYVRYRFDERLEEEFFRASSSQSPLSLILFDIDHFKSVNDRWGHTIGDEVLETVASLILKSTRGTDFCARYGGEEIAIIMPLTKGENALLIADRIRNKVMETKFGKDGLTVTISGGVAALGPKMLKVEDLFVSVDKALYGAKESGRNKVLLA